MENFNPIEQKLFETRTVFLTGPVNADLADKVNRQLLALEKNDPLKPIVLWINSPGGEVYSGLAIYDMARFIKPKIITIVAGMAASMGSIVALTAEKEDRLALPNAKFLIHQPLLGGTLQGPASDLEIHAKDIIGLKKKIHHLYAERCEKPVELFQELLERDRWVDPVEAVELGLISRIVQSREELGL